MRAAEIDAAILKNKLLTIGIITWAVEPPKEATISDSTIIKSKHERAVENKTNEKLFAVPIYFLIKSIEIAVKM